MASEGVGEIRLNPHNTLRDLTGHLAQPKWEYQRLPAWQERAACRDEEPDVFFPDKANQDRAAKRICTGCVVQRQCLEFALEHGEEYGVWGGMTTTERKQLKKDVDNDFPLAS